MKSESGSHGEFILGLALHPTKDVSPSIDLIEQWAETHEVTIAVREVDGAHAQRHHGLRVLSDEAFLQRVNGVVSLGGDGTMLGVMRLFVDRPVPVMGVNYGNLGFLIEVGPNQLEEALGRLVLADFSLESYSCLDVSRSGVGQSTGDSVAFNDIVIAREGVGSAVLLDLEVNGSSYGYYRSDAVIVSTAIGSTAYNYAAGGPVLSPSHSSLVVTPVAPMSGISRSIVFGPDDEITLRAHAGDANTVVSHDGTQQAPMSGGHQISIRLRPDAASVVRLDAETHSQIGRVKLSLLDLPLLPEQMMQLVPPDVRDTLRRHD